MKNKLENIINGFMLHEKMSMCLPSMFSGEKFIMLI